ncbi:sulfatase [Adhaeribacter aerolatus]|uniref:Sulfatase n=1 Tax=Adhaeribacter aerolatus TaxID=670289 RepID=A0A512B3G1_9BACT|nr:sulfatase [Adhaeribacter aerolatus]GEO06491.1 sulfatase [Adhaeribacter aerolatus]
MRYLYYGLVFLASLIFQGELYAQNPNILWITIEDTSPHFVGAYGNTQARTPVIDGLAKDGVRFTNAFSTGTVCSPSRFTLITGVRTYEAGTGNHRSAYPIPDLIKGFPAYLRNSGYYTTNNAKTDYNTSAEKRVITEAWNESSVNAGWWKRQPKQPFFAVFNFMDSHQSRTMTNTYDNYVKAVLNAIPEKDRIGENDFDMPPFYRDTPEMRKQVARVYNSLKLTDIKIGKLLDRLKEDKLTDSTIIFFFGDHGEGIPRAKTNGIGLGYHVPSIIWFPPMYRHLSPWGSNGVVTDELINFEDLAPTILSLAGIKAPDYMKGRAILGTYRSPARDLIFASNDRSDEGADLVRSATDGRYVYSRNFMPFMPENRWIQYQEVSDIKKQMYQDFIGNKLNAVQKNLFLERPTEFLFDIDSDPWELQNLIDKPEMQHVANKMRQAVQENIMNSRDILFLPEYELAELSKTTTPYEFRLDKSKYPLGDIYAAAAFAGKRGKSIALKQAGLLTHPNNIVRYWAIMGFKSQPLEIQKQHKIALTKAMKNGYAPVQIIAAAINVDAFGDQEAEQLLKKYCFDPNDELALFAFQNITYLKDIKPYESVIVQADANKNRKATIELQSAYDVLLQRLGIRQIKL